MRTLIRKRFEIQGGSRLGPPVAELLVETGLALNKKVAANFISAGRVTANMNPVLAPADRILEEWLILGYVIVRVETKGQVARWAQVLCQDVPLDDRIGRLTFGEEDRP